MKNKALPFILGAAGFFIGYQATTSASRHERATDSRTVNTRHSSVSGSTPGGRSPTAASKPPPRTLKSLLQRAPAMEERSSGLVDEMKRMKTEELQSVFESIALMNPRSMDRPDEIVAYGILANAMQELYSRQGDKLMEWASGPGDPLLVAYRLRLAAETMGRISPESLVRFADQFSALSPDVFNTAKHHSVHAAAQRSADDLIMAIRTLGYGLSEMGMPPVFAEDFDFAKLVRTLPLLDISAGAVMTWAAKDPEAAWEGSEAAMQIHADQSSFYMQALYRGVAAAKSDAEAAGWIAPKLQPMPPEEKAEIVRVIINQSSDPDQTAVKLLGAFTTDAERVAMAASRMNPGSNGSDYRLFGTGYTDAAFEALGSQTLQRDAILKAIDQLPITFRQQGAWYFQALADRVGLDPGAKTMIRKALEQPPE